MTARLAERATQCRDTVEAALFEVVSMLRDVDEVSLRVRQAMRRSQASVDVLAPAVDLLGEMRGRLIKTRETLAGEWDQGQRRRWKDE